jgi:hypothetical protein
MMTRTENNWRKGALLLSTIFVVSFTAGRGNAADETTFSNRVQSLIVKCQCLATNVLKTDDINTNDIPLNAPIFMRGLNPNLFMLLNPQVDLPEMRPGINVRLPESRFDVCINIDVTNTLYLEADGHLLANIRCKLRKGSYAAAKSEKLSHNTATYAIVSTSCNLCPDITFEDSIIVSEKFYDVAPADGFGRWNKVLSVSDDDVWLLSFFLGSQSECRWNKSGVKGFTH